MPQVRKFTLEVEVKGRWFTQMEKRGLQRSVVRAFRTVDRI
jgi:hypothetical protein